MLVVTRLMDKCGISATELLNLTLQYLIRVFGSLYFKFSSSMIFGLGVWQQYSDRGQQVTDPI